MIPCEAGSLQGRIQYIDENPKRPGVILCPPHPLLAGNMDNNVITALAERLAKYFTVLSFNYRNVGGSFKAKGDLPLFEYWDRLDQANDFTEICRDVAQVLDWSGRFFSKFHLIGYSFGSFIGQSVLTDSVLSLCCITPPLGEHEFALETVTCPSLFVFAGEDDLLDGTRSELPRHTEVREITGCDHFFLGKEGDVCDVAESFILGI
jgi:alpha/beta superfamily hydrolase